MNRSVLSIAVALVAMATVADAHFDYGGIYCILDCRSALCAYALWYCPVMRWSLAATGSSCAAIGYATSCVNDLGVTVPNGGVSEGATETCDCVIGSLVNCVPNTYDNVYAAICADPQTSTLCAVVSDPAYAPVKAILEDSSLSLTLFAPTNDALAAALVGIDPFDPAVVPVVTEILAYHALGVTVPSSALAPFQAVETLQGTPMQVRVNVDLPGVVINFASTVIMPDVSAQNGVVHVIDAMLVPHPSIVDILASDPQLTTLVTVLTDPRYEPVLTVVLNNLPLTVFAPTNAAFAALGVNCLADANVPTCSAVIAEHVARGFYYYEELDAAQLIPIFTIGDQKMLVQKSSGLVVFNNGQAALVRDPEIGSNGVVMVIDGVLFTSGNNFDLPSLVESIVFIPDLNELLGMVTSSPAYQPVIDAVSAPGITLFAPNNNAFTTYYWKTGILPEDAASNIPVLAYHVIEQPIESADIIVSGGGTLPTLAGVDLTVTLSSFGVNVQAADVVHGDFGDLIDIRSNVGSVMHVINEVLIPGESLVGRSCQADGVVTISGARYTGVGGGNCLCLDGVWVECA